MNEQPPARGPHIYTIGHSNHDMGTFIGLLHQYRIEVLVDVRSRPYSSYAPHFAQQPLREALAGAGLKYLFLGRQLGGRPDGAQYYDAEGHVLYDRVAASQAFLEGLARLQHGIARYTVAMLCAEEDPGDCHRRLLVGRVLHEHGVTVEHIRASGVTQSEDDLRAAEDGQDDHGQLALFETPPREKAWRSIRSVLPKDQRRTSSAPCARPASSA